MKVSDYIANFLYAQGVNHVFELVGGMITHLVDSIGQAGNIKIISVHHEQAGAFAAEACARMTGVPGVALATSGPGATNLLTGIGSCYFDSVPVVFITGQVNRSEQKENRLIRQLGFQETDIVSMVQPITKAAWLVREPERIPDLLADAFMLALSGRPGPVLLDIPMDVQRADIVVDAPTRVSPQPARKPDPNIIERLFSDLQQAQRPLILIGGGLRSGRAETPFRRLVDLLNVPIVNSLMAMDCLPYTHRLRVGMIGTYGNRWANLAIGRADFLVVLGSRLDVRQTGSETDLFKGGRIIYHVDCEEGEINNRVKGCFAIHSDLSEFLVQATDWWIRSSGEKDCSAWLEEIVELRNQWPDTEELVQVSGINPNQLMHQISTISTPAAAFVVDVGQHQMWAAQSLELLEKQRFITSGGMGAMGFALPSSIGVAISSGVHQPVVMIAGDGGFQLNIQELQTIIHHRLPIKMIIVNNQCHGMVRQFQQSYFDERYHSTYWGYSSPDLAKVAEAYGIKSKTVSASSEIPAALDKMWEDVDAPFLLQVMIDMFTNTYPKIAFGCPMTEMEPFAKPLDMEGT